jgi:hypothetical protein
MIIILNESVTEEQIRVGLVLLAAREGDLAPVGRQMGGTPGKDNLRFSLIRQGDEHTGIGTFG